MLRPHDGENAELGHRWLAAHDGQDAVVFLGVEPELTGQVGGLTAVIGASYR